MPYNLVKIFFRPVLLVLLLTIPGTFYIAAQTYSFRKYTVEDGLPENRVMHIWEDRNGFLWLSTKNGLTRFDGQDMVTYNLQDGLPDLYIRAVSEDSGGRIWVESVNGVAVYNGSSFTKYPLPVNRPYNELWPGMIIDNLDNIWLTAHDSTGLSSLVLFREGSYHLYSEVNPEFEGLNIDMILNDPATEQIYLLIDKKTYLFEKHGLKKIMNKELDYFFHAGEEFGGSSDNIDYFIRDNKLEAVPPLVKTGNWIKPVLTIINRDDGSFSITDLVHELDINWRYGFVNGFFQDSDSAIWVASEEGLFKLLSGSIRNFGRADLPESNIWSVVEDINGDIILGSLFGKLVKYDHKEFKVIEKYSKYSPAAFTVGSKRLSDGRCWLNTFRGIIQWDGTSFMELDFTGDEVECIYEDPDEGLIFVGAAKEGLYVLSRNDTLLFDEVKAENLGYARDICKDSEGIYWVVTDKSVYRFDGKEFTTFEESANPVRNGLACGIDSAGTLWFGGPEGLSWYDRENKFFAPAMPENENSPVKFIRVMDDSKMMVGRNGDFIIIDLERWRRGEPNFYKTFDRSNGFTGEGCIQNGVMKDRNGIYWILGTETITLFNPEDEAENLNPPRIYIASADILDDHLNWNRKYDFNIYKQGSTGRLVFKYFENNIRFSVTGISNHRPEKVLYRYRLGGNEFNWSQPTPGRMIVLPGLKPGRYTFYVEACSDEGIWSVKPASIELVIKPAFWQTLLFRTASIAISLAIIILLSVYLLKRRQDARREKIRTVREYYRLQMGKFIQQFDPHFTFNVLASVVEMIASGRKDEAEEYLMRFSRLLRVVVSEEGYLRRLGDELDFIRDYCEMQKIRMGERFDFSITVDNTSALEIEVPRMVIHNFVENAVKWGIGPKPEGGRVNISVSGSGPWTVKITDTGSGREAASKRTIKGTGKGMKVTRELFEMLNQINRNKIRFDIIDITGDSGECKGTEVIINIPMKFNFFHSE